MGAGKSLPTVSAKVIADIEQFISELKRSERATRSTADNIDKELSELAKKTAKKFELGDIGKDLLKGAGLFGGFQIAQTVADAVAGHFRDAAEAAKEIEASSMRSLEHTRKMIAMNQTDEERLNTLKRQRDEAAKTLEQLQKVEKVTRTIYAGAGATGGRPMPLIVTEELPRDMERIRKLTHELEQLDEAINPLTKKKVRGALSEFFGPIDKEYERLAKLNEENAEHEAKNQNRKIAALKAGVTAQEKAFDELIASQKKADDSTAKAREEAGKLADKYKELADPALRYRKEIAEINALHSDGKLKAEEAARAIDAVNRAMASDERGRVNKALDEFFDEMDKKQQDLTKLKDTAHEMGWAFSSAFEDAVIEGKKLSEVLDGLYQDILRIALRKSITEPLGNWVSGGISTVGKMLGFASGGDFTVGGQGGTDSQVVAFRATPGEQVSVKTPGQKAAGGGGGTFYIDARGADRTGLANLEAAIISLHGSIEQRAVAAVMEAQRRRLMPAGA